MKGSELIHWKNICHIIQDVSYRDFVNEELLLGHIPEQSDSTLMCLNVEWCIKFFAKAKTP